MQRVTLGLLALALAGVAGAAPPVIERVSTAVPYPRGLAIVDGQLIVLARGRVRGAGGVTAAVDDQAGTLYRVDHRVGEPLAGPPGEAVRTNARVLARPTSPPFRLWNPKARPPESDRWADRPYCTLRYHAPTRSLYLCAFAGIDKPYTPTDRVAFSKNLTDAVLRYDLRIGRWVEVERHRIGAGGSYPHHDPRHAPPPHGWLNGPDNCLALGRWLYVVAKDNNRLVRYDLAPLVADPAAGPPPSALVLGAELDIRGRGRRSYYGHSALAYHDGWLYIGYRTSSVIVRIRLDRRFLPRRPRVAELIARFDPYDPRTGRSANLTDMGFDAAGRLYVVSAKPARIYRLTPDPARVADFRGGRRPPWADLPTLVGRPRVKSENVLVHDGWAYVTTGDAYGDAGGLGGTVYRIRVD